MRLLFILAIAVAGFLIYKLYFQQLMAQGKAGKIKIAMIVGGLILLLAAVTGRGPAVLGIVGAAMTQVMRLAPLFIKFAPSLTRYFGNAVGPGSAGGQNESRVRTKSLLMTLDHASGKMDGEILSGALAGKRLSDLTQNELKRFYQDCTESDPEALRILQAYIARERSDWKDAPEDTSGGEQPKIGDTVTVREAYDILGLEQGATKKEITQAHKQLMMQFHPDRGGSNYLASKVNEAKKVLLAHVAED